MSEINKAKLENAFSSIRQTKNDVAANNDISEELKKPGNETVMAAYYDLNIKIDDVMDAILKCIS